MSNASNIGFEQMLAACRAEFGQLDGRAAAGRSAGARRLPAEFAALADTPAAKALDERYGDSWRFEMLDHRREADQLMVTATVRILGKGLSVTQTGRATLGPPQAALRGTVNGVAFRAAGPAPPAGGAEQEVLLRALRAALTNCARWLSAGTGL